jgi:hypothetical protein
MCSSWMNSGAKVEKKTQECWLWVALCRRTRQVVAYTIGDRSQEGAMSLREHLPEGYRRLCHAQRLLAGLRSGLSKAHPPLLRQGARRDQPPRTLVWHVARPRQPLGATGLFLLQARGAPPRRHPPLPHQLQSRHRISNYGLNITLRSGGWTPLQRPAPPGAFAQRAPD